MVCPKCGSPVSADDESCSNCGADLNRSVERPEDKSEDLRQMVRDQKADQESPHSYSEGQTIADRFDIREFVARGPFGEVYRAKDSIIETAVALKLFDEEVVRTPPEREEFLDATRAARTMTQENVVRIHDSGVHEDRPWVSMQYLEGLTLAKTIELRTGKGESFSLEELEPIVTQITLALQHIGREFPHGNLKPTNVFFLPDLVKITDGYILAALPRETFCGRLEESEYLAPELEVAPEQADPRCDVYSLGRIVEEMLFGAPGARTAAPAVDTTEVEDLCERATAEDPADRYPTVEAFSEDFSTLVDTGQLLEQGPPGGSAPPEGPAGHASDEELPDTGVEPAPDAPNAEFPEDEVATRDYDRDDPGPGPTTEMDRSASPTEEYDDPGAAPTEEYDREPPVTGGATNEVDRDSYPPSGAKPADELPPEPELPTDKAPDLTDRSEGGDGGPGAAALVGGLVVVFAIIGLTVYLLPGGSGDAIVLSDQKSDEKQKQEKQNDSPGEEAVAASISTGARALRSAVDRASDRAAERADEMEQEEEAGTSGGGRAGQSGQTGAAATSTGGGAESQKPKKRTDCPDGMALVKWDRGNYCIDRYEYPGAGQNPMTNVSWFQAESKCEAAGKRLCTLTEFRRACGGTYPWGSSWDPNKCNTRDESGFSRSLTAAGEFEECRSWPGVYDMVGNAHEWVKEQKIAGGGFDSGEDHATCRSVSPKSAGSSARTVGFRCCADAR